MVKNNIRRNLPFPGLITAICQKNGVPISESGFTQLTKYFDQDSTIHLLEMQEKAAKAKLRRRGAADQS